MMANKQILPWIWVVEALASSDSVDTSLLLQLAKMIPDKYGEMGKNARETVLLRILEGLVDRGDDENNDRVSYSGKRIQFDPSTSCQEVLQRILEDARASDIGNGGLKMLKWDVQSFIASKRARLRTPVLQKLKDAILEGSLSVSESLKETSGITVRTRDTSNVSANGGHSGELVHRHEEYDKNTEAVDSCKTSNFASADKCDDELPENVHEQNLLPAKRKRSRVSAEISERHTITREDCCDPDRETTKKHKHADNCPRHDSVGFTIASSQHAKPVNPSEFFVENVETEVHRLDKEADPEDMEYVASPNNMERRQAYDANTTEACGNTEREADKRHKQVENCPRHGSMGITIISSQHEMSIKLIENLVNHDETEMHRPDKEADVEDEFVVSPNDMGDQLTLLRSPANPVVEDNGKKLSSPVQCQNDKIGEGHRGHEAGAGAAGTNDHNETSDMNLMKNAFLSGQYTFSQDSLATQLKLCMKCNNGGEVLVCCSDTCAIAVHESCLGSTANMDCGGRFYCPFCAYSRAISEYLEVTNRATLARKNLTIFIGQKVDDRKMADGSDNSKINESKRDDNASKRNVPNNNRASSSRVNQESSRG